MMNRHRYDGRSYDVVRARLLSKKTFLYTGHTLSRLLFRRRPQIIAAEENNARFYGAVLGERHSKYMAREKYLTTNSPTIDLLP